MPHVISNNKRKRFKHYATNKHNSCKCQEKIKAKTVVQEKKIKEKTPKTEMEDIVVEVFV